MSKFSVEYHIKSSYQKTLQSLKQYYEEKNYFDIEILSVEEIQKLNLDDFDLEYIQYVVLESSSNGWTIIVSDYNRDENLVKFISQKCQCPALYGHNNDSTDNWRWIYFEEGNIIDEYWYLGQEKDKGYRIGEGDQIKNLYNIFKAKGTKYLHEIFSHILSSNMNFCVMRINKEAHLIS